MVTTPSVPSVHDLLAGLTIEGHTSCPALPWLEESWRDPGRFFRDLAAGQATALPARPKSVVLERYDLSFDLVGRSALGDRPAFRWEDRQEGWQTLSYAELAELSARRAGEWAHHGVEAGQTLCIVRPFGPEWVIALLAAIRLGCVVSFLPPAGARFFARRLAALAPDHIATTDLYVPSLGPSSEKALPRDLPPRPRRDESFVHTSGAIFARLFSPLSARPDLPIELTVDEAYCHALRDGLLAHGLAPGDAFAAPGVDLLQYQPSLLLATFLAGAEYVHVELDAVAREPAAFAALDLAVVGVMPRVRDLLLEAGAQLGRRWRHWWRGVNEESDHPRWHRFVGEAGLNAVPTSNLLVDAAAGGALFFSARRRQKHGGMSYFVLPSAGTAWSLEPLGVPGASRPGPGAGSSLSQGLGTYAARPLVGKEPPAPGSHILRRQPGEWFYAGVARPNREGRTYPSSEVLECVAGLPFLEGASIVAMTTADPARPFSFHLVGFVGRARTAELAEQREAWRRAIEGTISNALAPTFTPDRVELFPFSPRWHEGEVDPMWCHDRYARGLLHDRVAREVHLLLDALRALIAAPASHPAAGD